MALDYIGQHTFCNPMTEHGGGKNLCLVFLITWIYVKKIVFSHAINLEHLVLLAPHLD